MLWKLEKKKWSAYFGKQEQITKETVINMSYSSIWQICIVAKIVVHEEWRDLHRDRWSRRKRKVVKWQMNICKYRSGKWVTVLISEFSSYSNAKY